MSCSRTQHGGGRFRTPDLSLRSPTLYHWATALPKFCFVSYKYVYAVYSSISTTSTGEKGAGWLHGQPVLSLIMLMYFIMVAKPVITRRHFLCWMADAITANWSIRRYTFSYFFVDLEASPMFYSLGVWVYFLLINSVKIAILYCCTVS